MFKGQLNQMEVKRLSYVFQELTFFAAAYEKDGLNSELIHAARKVVLAELRKQAPEVAAQMKGYKPSTKKGYAHE